MIDQINQAYYSAILVDLPDIVEYRYDYENGIRSPEATREVRRRPSARDVEIYSFTQTWGSTALGFGGIGGQAMTAAQTTIVTDLQTYCVYFGGRLAYKIESPNTKLIEDIMQHNVAAVGEQGKYQRGHKN